MTTKTIDEQLERLASAQERSATALEGILEAVTNATFSVNIPEDNDAGTDDDDDDEAATEEAHAVEEAETVEEETPSEPEPEPEEAGEPEEPAEAEAAGEDGDLGYPYPSFPWKWKSVQSYAWVHEQHINILEFMAFYNYLR